MSLIAFSLFGDRSVPTPLNWVNDVNAMVGRIVSTPANAFMNFSDSITELKNTYEENQSLKRQIGTLQELKVQNQRLKEDNAELTNLIGLAPSLEGKKVIASSVISRSPNEWVESLTIDVGSNNGIEKDMSVMTDAGLIGRVYEVGPTSSKVRLLTSDADNHIDVAAGIQTEDAIEYGVVSAYDRNKNELVVEQVAADAKIKKGDVVTTNGLGGVSPEGLIIGEVTESSVDNFGLSKQIRVKPSADFNDIRHVFVVMTMGTIDKENDAEPITIEEDTFVDAPTTDEEAAE